MDKIEFVKGLDRDKVYLIGLARGADVEELDRVLRANNILAIFFIKPRVGDITIIEPIGIDKAKLRELLK